MYTRELQNGHHFAMNIGKSKRKEQFQHSLFTDSYTLPETNNSTPQKKGGHFKRVFVGAGFDPLEKQVRQHRNHLPQIAQ